MKILILGGSKFVGRLCAEEAVARGHDVTIFNRGTRSTVEGVTTLTGDRLAPNGYAALDGLSFDCAIDTWALEAEVVKSAVDALRGRVGHFIYVSTISVYNDGAAPQPISESCPVWEVDTAPHKYAKDKIGGEVEAVKSGVPTLLPRPGVILGPYEEMGQSEGRLLWWLRRMSKGGPVLAPGPPDLHLQIIDGRDLAKFTVDGAEKKLTGAVSILSPERPTMREFLEACNEAVGNKAQLHWLDADKVLAAGILPRSSKPRVDLPLWVLETDPASCVIYNQDVRKAVDMGMTNRSIKDTVAATWAWMQKDGVDGFQPPARFGVELDKEAAVLKEHFGTP